MDRSNAELAHVNSDRKTEDSWRVDVASDRCLTSGSCISLAPDYFRLAMGVSRAIRPVVPPDERLRDAAQLCPAAAILVRRTTDGSAVAP